MGGLLELHSILIRQLGKSGLDPDTAPGALPAWSEFLASINGAYIQSDQERCALERSVEITSREMQSLNAHLLGSNQTLKENQAQLVQSEKMASLGQLAAGVAHEINNPVSFLISNLERLSEYVETLKGLFDAYDGLEGSLQGGDAAKRMEALSALAAVKKEGDFDYIRGDLGTLLLESIEGVYRVKEIVQNLKSFARVDEADIKEADLNEGIEATLKIIWNELKYKCKVTRNLSPLPRIACHPRRLNQVFLNLLVNASQAIPVQGDIIISSGVEGGNIVIRVTDTGEGMPPEVIPKIFTPFFTTKPIGKGTGLGLSISYGIVQNHGGEITVESEVGKGTTFTMTLPIARPGHEG